MSKCSFQEYDCQEHRYSSSSYCKLHHNVVLVAYQKHRRHTDEDYRKSTVIYARKSFNKMMTNPEYKREHNRKRAAEARERYHRNKGIKHEQKDRI